MAEVCHGKLYQPRLKKAFNKKVCHRLFEEGDLGVRKILLIHKDPRGKWTPKYEWPYVVKKAFFGGALTLTTMDEAEFP